MLMKDSELMDLLTFYFSETNAASLTNDYLTKCIIHYHLYTLRLSFTSPFLFKLWSGQNMWLKIRLLTSRSRLEDISLPFHSETFQYCLNSHNTPCWWPLNMTRLQDVDNFLFVFSITIYYYWIDKTLIIFTYCILFFIYQFAHFKYTSFHTRAKESWNN